MTSANREKIPPETFWRRWMGKLAAFSVAIDMSYDDLQDRRMDRIEAELMSLRSAQCAHSSQPERP